MNRFGIDKPDTRFGMELVDFTEEFKSSQFKVFSGAIANGGVVKALNAKGMAEATQGQIETMTEYAKGFGAIRVAISDMVISVDASNETIRRTCMSDSDCPCFAMNLTT
jgi:aspartyl-tRNA synthetase